MTTDQILIFVLLTAILANFIWGKFRFDFVSLAGLLIATFIGLVPAKEAFSGFSHPAVITVAAILILSEGLMSSGFVDAMVKTLETKAKSPIKQFYFLVGGVAFFSAFMNNVGAMALFMPVAIKIARRNQIAPSQFLMPMAFSSLLGGMITLVGSPPNIIISTFRVQSIGKAFRMFDFAPIGIALCIVIIPIIIYLAPKLIPQRRKSVSQEDFFEITDYTYMVKLTEGSNMIGKSLMELGAEYFSNVNVIGYVRNKRKHARVSPYLVLQENDLLLLESSTANIQDFLRLTKLSLSGSKKLSVDEIGGNGIVLSEVVVTPTSNFVDRTARDLNLRNNFGVNLLGVARVGQRVAQSPNRVVMRPGDVLLLQGSEGSIQEVISDLGALPLQDRGIQLQSTSKITISLGIFVAVLLLVAVELLRPELAFATAALLMIATGIVSIQSAYDAMDLPVLFLLGGLIPVSSALETTGAANLIAESIVKISSGVPAWATVLLVLIITMALTNIINNAAAALIMAPVAISIAQVLDLNVDPFLLAVFVGATSAYLTPIGHQSNTIVMGPGGYHFGDYWRLGLPVSILTCVVSMPVILFFWPL